jgi:hypothetical protein
MFYMHDGNVTGWVRQMTDQEWANTDLTTSEYAAFLDAFEFVWKDGGYGCDSVNWGGAAGWSRIPFRGTFNGQILSSSQSYAFSLLFDDVASWQADNDAYAPFYRELLREPVRAALQSWDSICEPAVFTNQPDSQSEPVGGTVSFTTAIATSPSTSNYVRQWQVSFNGGNGWSNVANASGHISGATTGTLTISNVVTSDAALYRLRIMSGCGSAFSTSAQLTVTPACTAPTVATQPTAQTVTSGEDAVFSVVAGGSSAGRTYQWQKAPAGGGLYTSLQGVVGYSGATTATLTVVDATDSDEALYRCRITNSCGSVNSNGVLLTVEPACVPPTITNQPDSVTIDEGGEASFSIAVSGSATNRTFQWQKRSTLGIWSDVSNVRGVIGGATTATLTFFEVAETNEGDYRCLVNNDCGHPISSTARLTVNPVAPPCGTSDFNGDGDFGTDQDIEAFFACLAGTCCPTCWQGGSDFNGDGDFGTDQDIESFFRVLAGGPC